MLQASKLSVDVVDVADVVDVVGVVDVVDVGMVDMGMEAMVGGLVDTEDPDGGPGGGAAGGDRNGTLTGSQLTHGSRSSQEGAKMAALI